MKTKLITAVILVVLAIASFFIFFKKETETEKTLFEQKRSDIEQYFKISNPSTNPDGIYTYHKDSELELIVKTREMDFSDGYKTTFIFADKEIELTAEFRVKYGYKLGKELVISEEEMGILNISGLGKLEVLSVEKISNIKVTKKDSTLWNRVTDKEKLKIAEGMRGKLMTKLNETSNLQSMEEECYSNLCEQLHIEKNKLQINPKNL